MFPALTNTRGDSATRRRAEGEARGTRSPVLSPWACLAVALTMTSGLCAASENWTFQRSYYSHDLSHGQDVPPVGPVPYSRTAYRPAYYQEFPSGGFRGTFRINNNILRNGSRTDQTIYYESWFELRP